MSNHPEPEHTVVVGGGAAAHRLIGAHREAGGQGRLTMISADDRLPYFRPALTKELLTGDQEADSIGLDGAEWYAAHGVDVRLGERVEAVDLATRTIRTDREPIAYDALVFATGSRATSLPVPGADGPHVMSIRSAADSLAVIEATTDGAPFVVVGSGFVGCEAASSLRARGIDVTMVSLEQNPQHERLGSEPAATIAEWLRDHGVDLRTNRTVERIEQSGSAVSVHTSGGQRFEAGHVLVAAGAAANSAIGENAGLAVRDGGIVVDASMRTAAPGVFAVGDVAIAHNTAAGRHLRVEHWGDAEEMGRVAGVVLAGEVASWSGVPGFWSTICGHELKYSAWGDGWDDVRVRRSPSGFTAWYGTGGVTVGVLTWNHDEDQELGRMLVSSGAPLPV